MSVTASRTAINTNRIFLLLILFPPKKMFNIIHESCGSPQRSYSLYYASSYYERAAGTVMKVAVLRSTKLRHSALTGAMGNSDNAHILFGEVFYSLFHAHTARLNQVGTAYYRVHRFFKQVPHMVQHIPYPRMGASQKHYKPTGSINGN